jgi:hypothetical protein
MTKSDNPPTSAEITVRRATLADLDALAVFNTGIALETEGAPAR